MYNVSQSIIDAYKQDGVHKLFRIVINGTSYSNDQIVDNSFNLKQSILENESFEAIGCIASSLSVELHAQFPTKIKGALIKAYIKTADTSELCIFTGYVDKCTKTANGWKRSIDAYDILYNLSGQSGQGGTGQSQTKYDVTDWFNEHSSTSLSTLLTQICSKYGISVQEGNRPLANGSITTTCGSVKPASSISALDVIKAIMQLNGCFGYITGEGYFSWKYLIMHSRDDTGTLYPSQYVYPASNLYPGTDSSQVPTPETAINYIGEYENLEYQDYQMLPINKVEVKNYDKDEEGGSCGSGENVYSILGNILIKDADSSTKSTIAQNIYDELNNTWYVPFSADLLGLPYLECGDEINFTDFVGDAGHASLNRYYIMSRTLSGGQHLKDGYSASGNEYLHEFVSGTGDSNANDAVEELRDEIEDNYPTNEEMEEAIENAGSLFSIVSVSYSDLPQNPDPRTLYLIQGDARFVDSLGGDGDDDNESGDESII